MLWSKNIRLVKAREYFEKRRDVIEKRDGEQQSRNLEHRYTTRATDLDDPLDARIAYGTVFFLKNGANVKASHLTGRNGGLKNIQVIEKM